MTHLVGQAVSPVRSRAPWSGSGRGSETPFSEPRTKPDFLSRLLRLVRSRLALYFHLLAAHCFMHRLHPIASRRRHDHFLRDMGRFSHDGLLSSFSHLNGLI